MDSLSHKVALVTSSTKGIGLACAKALAGNGALVYIAARNRSLAKEVIQEITDAGGKAKFVHFDAREEETYADMIDTVIQNEGRLDILVNNYGGTNITADKNLTDGDKDAFFHIVRDNLQSVYLPCRAAVPAMMEKGGGSIVNISSIGSVIPDLSRLAYCVSKSAINALTQNIAVQYAPYHIRCNAVLPGLIATKAALESMSDEFRSSFLRHVPLGRIGTPEDVADAVLYFAKDGSSFVTGTLLEVAGGFGQPTPQYAEFRRT